MVFRSPSVSPLSPPLSCVFFFSLGLWLSLSMFPSLSHLFVFPPPLSASSSLFLSLSLAAPSSHTPSALSSQLMLHSKAKPISSTLLPGTDNHLEQPCMIALPNFATGLSDQRPPAIRPYPKYLEARKSAPDTLPTRMMNNKIMRNSLVRATVSSRSSRIHQHIYL